MAELYSLAKSSKLKLKGKKNNLPKKKKASKRTAEDAEAAAELAVLRAQENDTKGHGGWWDVTKFQDISGQVAIEFGERCYVKCLDDGTFTLGAPHDEGEGPAPEEIFTAIKINDEKIALKSGYGKYLGVDSKSGSVVGRSDAVGAIEQWEVVFEGKKMALLSHSGHFMSVDPVEESVVCKNRKAGDAEIIRLRSMAERKEPKRAAMDEAPPEERVTSVKDIEINYVKKFQKFQDKKMRLCPVDLDEVKKAKEEGNLHESLLDRRSKMKADRYCK